MAWHKSFSSFRVWGTKYRNGVIPLEDLCRKIADGIDMELLGDGKEQEESRDELCEIRDRFTELANDSDITVDYFDNILDDLYNWADAQRVWIEPTF